MVGKEAVEELQFRKRTLLLESGLNRMALEADWEDFRAATARVRSAGQAFRLARPWLVVLASLAGFLVARRPARRPGLLSRLGCALRWLRPLLGLWGVWRLAPGRSPSGPAS